MFKLSIDINLQEKKTKTGNKNGIRSINCQGKTNRKKGNVVDLFVKVPSKSKMATVSILS
ncbi:hypothetical protein TUM19329_34560 [Legionella antarctica]|uniref:Uncharacterized protein n=1 Tax=Legionella antarctica TaxID=2708020 RepID=A0A6F8T8T3_9GAMM|nr:hypothetical protein TUM19329_34560 [Legionella antarctica]